MNRYKKSGWFNESVRHGLAARGVKTGRKSASVGAALSKNIGGIRYAKSWGNKEFRIDDHTTIVCHGEDTRYGFRHLCDLYIDGQLVDSAKATYQNRTWESYEYETAIKALLDKHGYSDEEKKRILGITSGRAKEETDSMFKSIGMVASLGEIFGKTPKEKNDWKLRMIKAGLGDKGFQVPEDWDTLSEEEKGKRLDKIIKFMNEKKVNR